MNNSVTVYAPKGETYSLPSLLDTRVSIASTSQIYGFFYLWEHVFEAFEVFIDVNLGLYLEYKDLENEQKHKV